MNPEARFPHPLELLIAETDGLAAAHRIPAGIVMVHALGMASALAGHLVTLRPSGTQSEIPATFPLTVFTPDYELPAWIQDDWQVLQHLAAESNTPGELTRSPAAIAEQRRLNRTMDLLDPHRNHIGNHLMEALARASNRRSYGRIEVISEPRTPAAELNQPPVTRLIAGLRLFKPTLRALAKDPETVRATPPNHIAWLQTDDMKTLAREEGPAVLGRLGTILHCGAASPPANEGSQVTQVSALVFNILQRAQFRNGRFHFTPSPQVRDSLDAHAANVRSLITNGPDCLRDLLVPEPRLAWHFAALFAAMCAGTQEEGSDHAAAVLGSVLAARTIRNHIVKIRRTFPADEQGFFEGPDLAVCRLLGQLPVPVRKIQRSRRGERKEDILRSLRRAIDAGLAVETSPGHFAAGPGPVVELSDYEEHQAPE